MILRIIFSLLIFFSLISLSYSASSSSGSGSKSNFDKAAKLIKAAKKYESKGKNEKAKKPSLVVRVDFGKEIGIKESSAQITHYYSEKNLVGKQVIGVCNFPKKNIAGILSEVLILGAIEKDGKVVLVHPSQKVENGLEIE